MRQQTVSQVIRQIKSLLEGEFRQIAVEGEVSNLSLSSSGHWYFTLVDRDSNLSAALFKMDALRNPHIKKLKNGDKVLCTGGIGVYGKRGTFQLIAKQIVPIGKGNLKQEFELLKKKLSAEDLFDIESKKKIPPLAKRVAVITAKGGAAFQDFLNIYSRRSLWSDIVLVPALVQGDLAPNSIRKALFSIIKYSLEATEENKIDVIVLTRGGGSLEDLWAFNDEALAWDIYNCPIPIISAVGHQVDFSISDFVSDLRCETPSAAAEILTENQNKLKEKLDQCYAGLNRSIKSKLLEEQMRIEKGHPRIILDRIRGLISKSQGRLNRCDLISRADNYLGINENRIRLDDGIKRLKQNIESRFKDYEYRLKKSDSLLKALGPQNVLERGYSYVSLESNDVVSRFKDFKKLDHGKELEIVFADGKGKVEKV